MDAGFIFNLKQPCKNRGFEVVDNKDGSVNINGNRFETMTSAEDYLLTFNRIDNVKF